LYHAVLYYILNMHITKARNAKTKETITLSQIEEGFRTGQVQYHIARPSIGDNNAYQKEVLAKIGARALILRAALT